MAAIVLRRTGTAIAACTLALAFAGEAPAAGSYEEFQRGIYLSYVNAAGADEDITRLPMLRVSFGGPPFNMVMDTGSTGIVVSAHRIPNINALPSLGPGQLTYTSSGRIMRGRWVVTTVTVMGADGARLATSPIPVLAVTRIECTPRARRCRPNDDPREVSMMGMGFGRGHGREAENGTRKNPFINIATIAAPGRDGESAQGMRRGYIVTRRGVHVGLTGENTQPPFSYVALARSESGNDWSGIPACITVNGATPAACGSMLMDTGVTAMYLTLPDGQSTAAAIRPDDGRAATLAPGTSLTISAPSAEAPQARYTFTVGDAHNPLSPTRLILVRGHRAPFVNTGLRFLNGFDYLFDADGGRAGFRSTGRVPAMPVR